MMSVKIEETKKDEDLKWKYINQMSPKGSKRNHGTDSD